MADRDASPPGLWRNPVLRRLFLLTLIAETAYATLNVSAMPIYLRDARGLSEAVVGFALVAFLLSEALLKGPMGTLADRFGRRWMMVAGPALTALTALATLAVPSGNATLQITLILALRVLDGMGAALLWPATFALVADVAPEGERSRAMSIMNICYLAGIGLALPLGGMANEITALYLGDPIAAKAASFFLACGLFVVSAGLASRLPRGARPPEVGLPDVPSAWRRIPRYLALAFVTFAGIGFPMAIVKLFATDQFGLSETKFGFIALPSVALMALLGVPISRLGERWGRLPSVRLGLGLCALGVGLVALGGPFVEFRSPVPLGVGSVLVGFGFLLALPAWYAEVSELDPQRRGGNVGAIMAAQGLGAITGAPIGAILYATLSGYGPDFARYSPWMASAGCLLVGFLLSFFLRRPQSESKS